MASNTEGKASKPVLLHFVFVNRLHSSSLSLSLTSSDLDRMRASDLQVTLSEATGGCARAEEQKAILHRGLPIFAVVGRDGGEKSNANNDKTLAQLGLHHDSTMFVVCSEEDSNSNSKLRDKELVGSSSSSEEEAAIREAAVKDAALQEEMAAAAAAADVITLTILTMGKQATVLTDVRRSDTLLDLKTKYLDLNSSSRGTDTNTISRFLRPHNGVCLDASGNPGIPPSGPTGAPAIILAEEDKTLGELLHDGWKDSLMFVIFRNR